MELKHPKARVIAYYLPQFHPIPENDLWWGKGFTEWTNVARAKPLFRGHYQPKLPADLGFYDLRLPIIREEQAQMARYAGIEGFCYWHYWFGNGKQLLEKPFEEVLQSGKPDFPFCLAWANHSWTSKTWHNVKGSRGQQTMIAEQLYPGDEDYINHFYSVLPALKDKRYITIDGKPVFVIFDPYGVPDVTHFIELWRSLAVQNGLPGIFFIGHLVNTTMLKRSKDEKRRFIFPKIDNVFPAYQQILDWGFDAVQPKEQTRGELSAYGETYMHIRKTLQMRYPWLPTLRISYPKVMQHFYGEEDKSNNVFPTLLAGWDRSPRAGNAEGVYTGYTPENFEKHIRMGVNIIKDKPYEHRILFLKSWNEWGEGNYVEPDLQYGHGFLDALHKVLFEA